MDEVPSRIGLPRASWRGPEPVYRLLAPVVALLTRLWVRLRVAGLERIPVRGGVVVAANHVSHVDPLVIVTALRRRGRRPRFLALSTLFDQRFVGWLLRAGRMIPVARGGGQEPMVADACQALAAGQLVVVYPEGQIVRPGTQPSAKPGAGLLALRGDVPVVPVAVQGLQPRRPEGFVPRFRSRVHVVVGSPIDLSPWRGRQDLAAQLEVADVMLRAVRSLAPPAP